MYLHIDLPAPASAGQAYGIQVLIIQLGYGRFTVPELITIDRS